MSCFHLFEVEIVISIKMWQHLAKDSVSQGVFEKFVPNLLFGSAGIGKLSDDNFACLLGILCDREFYYISFSIFLLQTHPDGFCSVHYPAFLCQFKILCCHANWTNCSNGMQTNVPLCSQQSHKSVRIDTGAKVSDDPERENSGRIPISYDPEIMPWDL